METTEKIIESYVRYVRRWATIPNVRCEGQYEIDLLAINPDTYEKYHIESSISASKGFIARPDRSESGFLRGPHGASLAH